MNKLSEYLKSPAPIIDKPWNFIVLNIIIVVAVLAIFEPFAFRLNSLGQFFMLLGFGLLAFLASVLFFIIFPRIFPSYFLPEKWTRGRMLLYLSSFLIFMGLCVFVYEYILIGRHSVEEYWTKRFFTIFFIDMVAGITVGLIPVTIFTYMARNRNLRKNLEEAVKLNESLSRRLKSEEPDNIIVLEGSTKDSISLMTDAILYIESAGNYVNVVYNEEGAARKKMLRSTIKQIEEILLPYNIFIRCHRAFIVNINHISNIAGNAQGYKLTLNNGEEEIPVSRTYMKALKDSLNQ